MRPASRLLIRSSLAAPRRPPPGFRGSRRLLNTAPPVQKSRSWKGTALRWGLAAGAVYYYNTSNLFASQPAYALTKQADGENDSELPSLDELVEERRRHVSAEREPEDGEDADDRGPQSPQALEEEADSQGAFNPETGEINWDCPCLGGMAHGPCGEEFRSAFSCFVYSTEEPKGMDCIDRFKYADMQAHQTRHPDIYGEELDNEDGPEDDSSGTAPDTEDESHSSTPRPSRPISIPSTEAPPRKAESNGHGEKVVGVRPDRPPGPGGSVVEKPDRAEGAARQMAQMPAESAGDESEPMPRQDETGKGKEKANEGI
ncbi:MAG: Oxidoreductase [Thelocarpon impressellum]|nr:MAG: Oxidoreductase [Thelocarpon impressellum]